MDRDDSYEIAGRKFSSRLIIGTGKYADFAQTRVALEASGAEMVTVAVRRVNITDPSQENLLDYVDPKRYTILPNTAGCYTAEDAVHTCRLAREAGMGDLVKAIENQLEGEILTNTRIRSIEAMEHGYKLQVESNGRPDIVITGEIVLAVSADVAAQLVEGFNPELAAALRRHCSLEC